MSNSRSISEIARSALLLAQSIVTRVLANTEHLRDKAVYFTGEGPYLIADLTLLLPEGIVSSDIGENPPHNYYEPPTVCVVVGRNDFDRGAILDCIENVRFTPAFLPQEGFFDLVLFGYDWWNDCCENLTELDRSLEYHEGLQYVRSLERTSFKWPTVEAYTIGEPGNSRQTFRKESLSFGQSQTACLKGMDEHTRCA